MTNASDNSATTANDGLQPTPADAVTAPGMPPMDDDAGGPTAEKEGVDEPTDEALAAQLGDFA